MGISIDDTVDRDQAMTTTIPKKNTYQAENSFSTLDLPSPPTRRSEDMKFINMFSGDLKEGKTSEFVAWLEANEQALADAHPEGSEYMGTYFNVVGGTADAGSVYTLIGMDSYGTMDALAETGGEYGRLLNEVIGFFDQSNGSNGDQVLLKKATEATNWGE